MLVLFSIMIISPGCENSPQKTPFLDSPQKRGGVGGEFSFSLFPWDDDNTEEAGSVPSHKPSVRPSVPSVAKDVAKQLQRQGFEHHVNIGAAGAASRLQREPHESKTILESGQNQRHATCKYVSIVATRTWSVDQWCHSPREGGREGGRGGTSIRAHANYLQAPGIAESCHTSWFGSQPCVCKSNHNSMMLPQQQLLLLLRCLYSLLMSSSTLAAARLLFAATAVVRPCCCLFIFSLSLSLSLELQAGRKDQQLSW